MLFLWLKTKQKDRCNNTIIPTQTHIRHFKVFDTHTHTRNISIYQANAKRKVQDMWLCFGVMIFNLTIKRNIYLFY